jgi:hypothetical protein
VHKSVQGRQARPAAKNTHQDTPPPSKEAQTGEPTQTFTVFSFGAVLDEYLERDLGIVLAALLQGGPRSLGVKVRLERDQ